MGYKVHAIKGVGWIGALQIILRLVGIIKIAILVRLLTPFDLGIYGMIFLVLSLFETFTEFGISSFLIQMKENIKQYISSAFAVQIGRGVAISILVAASSYPASIYFKEESIIPLILLISLVPLIKSFENPYIVYFQKELQFNKEFIIRFIAAIADLIFMVILISLMHSVTGLILAFLLSTTLYVGLTWVFLKNKISRPDKRKIFELLSFAKWISPLGILSYILLQGDSFFVGRILGANTLGLYQVTQKFSSTPMIDISNIVGKVTFPVYSKFFEDLKRLLRAYKNTVLSLAGVELVILIVFLVFSKEILFVLAGKEWAELSNLFRVLVIYGFLASVWGSIGSLFFSLKRQDILVKLAAIRVIILIPSIFVGINLLGTMGIALALVLNLVVILPFTIYFINQQFSSLKTARNIVK